MFYKVIAEENKEIGVFEGELLEVLEQLMRIVIIKNCFPFKELHIVMINKEEFEKTIEEINEDNEQYRRRN